MEAYKLLLEREKDEKWATIPAYILQVDVKSTVIFWNNSQLFITKLLRIRKAMQAAKLLELYKRKVLVYRKV